MDWTLCATADDFYQWLYAQEPDAVLGLPGGFREHPIARWLHARCETVLIQVTRELTTVKLYLVSESVPTLIPADHWITRFCHALMPPDSLREVTAAECRITLARVVNTPFA